MYQNAVVNYKGEVVGYKCSTCLKVYDSMWSHTCNACRDQERKHKELIKAIETSQKSCACSCHKKGDIK